MYKYSLLYLALLFVAMGVDRAIPFGHRPPAGKVMILDQTAPNLATPGIQHLH
jgi:hypothetical protein